MTSLVLGDFTLESLTSSCKMHLYLYTLGANIPKLLRNGIGFVHPTLYACDVDPSVNSLSNYF
jgi:hypothetical protein